MKHQNGWSIAYSGDCRPSPSFIELSKDCTVFIHEATMCVADHDLAVKKNHSTTLEAMSAGFAAGAKYVLMTHFSQRYALSFWF
jgi:ribonuclease Z